MRNLITNYHEHKPQRKLLLWVPIFSRWLRFDDNLKRDSFYQFLSVTMCLHTLKFYITCKIELSPSLQNTYSLNFLTLSLIRWSLADFYTILTENA